MTNKIQTTLPPLQARLVSGYAEFTGMTKSQVIADAVKAKFEAMPIQERDRILRVTDK